MKLDTKLKKVVCEVFGVPDPSITPDTDPDCIDAWDSLGHLNLIMAIEERFKVKFPANDIVLLDSVGKIQQALQKMGAI